MQAKREAFVAAQATLDPARLVFIDESGFRLGSPPRYGWAKRGEDAPGKGTHGAWRTVTMIGAMALDGFRSLVTIEAATSAEVFLAFVRDELVPSLRPGDIVVMDNLAAHKTTAIIDAIKRCGAELLFLPPYSPEYNPIEKAWGKLKDFARRLPTLTREAFDVAIAAAMDAVSSADISGWTAHAGYRLTST